MRMPSVRFTIRRMMVIVAVVAGMLWATLALQERSRRFLKIASEREMEVRALTTYYAFYPPFEHIARLDEMKKKYEYAASHPWLPVEPDPPVPSFRRSSIEHHLPKPKEGQSPFEIEKKVGPKAIRSGAG